MTLSRHNCVLHVWIPLDSLSIRPVGWLAYDTYSKKWVGELRKVQIQLWWWIRKDLPSLLHWLFLPQPDFSSTLWFCFISVYLPMTIQRDKGTTSSAPVPELSWLWPVVFYKNGLCIISVPYTLPRPFPEVKSIFPSFEPRGFVTISTNRGWREWCYVTSEPRSREGAASTCLPWDAPPWNPDTMLWGDSHWPWGETTRRRRPCREELRPSANSQHELPWMKESSGDSSPQTLSFPAETPNIME